MDLLMAVDWGEVEEEPWLIEEPLPALTGVLPVTVREDEGGEQGSEESSARAASSDEEGMGLMGTALIAVGGVVVFVLAGTVLMRRLGKDNRR